MFEIEQNSDYLTLNTQQASDIFLQDDSGDLLKLENSPLSFHIPLTHDINSKKR